MPLSSLTADLLGSPTRWGARVIAQARLRRVLQEAARVEVCISVTGPSSRAPGGAPENTDPEAVHDFRVALRRLRGWLRAFRPFLKDAIGKGPERRLRQLSRLAGQARDLEVQHHWLTGSGPGPSPWAGEGARWLAGRFAREEARARRALAASVVAELPPASADLAGALQRTRKVVARGAPAREPVMAVAMAGALREIIEVLPRYLERAERAKQVAEAHAARIAVKRLRYLLEAFGRSSRIAAAALPQLALLQDRFGELHDAQVLERRLSGELAAFKRHRGRKSTKGERPPPPAVQALRMALDRHVETTFRDARRASRSRDTTAMFARLSALVRRLERIGARKRRIAPAVSRASAPGRRPPPG